MLMMLLLLLLLLMTGYLLWQALCRTVGRPSSTSTTSISTGTSSKAAASSLRSHDRNHLTLPVTSDSVTRTPYSTTSTIRVDYNSATP